MVTANLLFGFVFPFDAGKKRRNANLL